MLIKIAAVQARVGQPLTLEQKIHLFRLRPDFVCLPEYWLIDATVPDYHRAAIRYPEYCESLANLSAELTTIVVGGTVVEPSGDRLHNTSIVYDRGREVGRYRKRYPVPGEVAKGISAGEGGQVIEIDGVRVGVMICGDVFYPELYDEMLAAEADVIFIPTTSPYRNGDTISSKQDRDRKYFLSGATRAAAYVCKVCAVGSIFGKPLQGRSLIAAPWGMVRQVDYRREDSQQVLSCTIDTEEIREFRERLARSRR